MPQPEENLGFDVPQGASEETAPKAAEGVPTPSPSAADPAPAEPKPDAVEDCNELPSCLAKSIALLQEADAMPQSNPEQERLRDARLSKVQRHVFRLQNGDPAPVPDAGYMAQDHAAMEESRRAKRIEQLERENPDVKFIMDENRKLKERASKKGK